MLGIGRRSELVEQYSHALTLQGEYDELLRRVFTISQEGIIQLGAARSKEKHDDLSRLVDWTLFVDYVMEGFIEYYVRLLANSSNVRLEWQLTGTNRDQFVQPAIKSYLKHSGVNTCER